MKMVLALLLQSLFTVTIALGQPHAKGYKLPPNWKEGAIFENIKAFEPLPESYDWRTTPGGLQPIRNQASCGSCWAFSITAVIESLARIKNPAEIDLAEQTLVSTCERDGDCGGGYFSAFNYARDKGLPNEAQDPYRARNSSCKPGLKPVAKIARWAYIGSGDREPTIEQLKTAIIQYGPISVAVNASFGNYREGIYDKCNRSGEDHMVNLEGWNDDGQYWIMRNSWGASWGEAGYMRIKYVGRTGAKCNNIGRTAAFAVLEETK